MANTHRKENWTSGIISFGGLEYPIQNGDTEKDAPIGVGGYLEEGERYIIFWEKGAFQSFFQTSKESEYDRLSKDRVVIAELTVPSNADSAGNFVEGNEVQVDIKADGQASQFTDTAHVWKAAAALPAYSFNGDPDTGMYSSADNEIHFATGGTERLEVSSAGITVTGAMASTTISSGAIVSSGAISGTTITGSGDITGSQITGTAGIGIVSTNAMTCGTTLTALRYTGTSWFRGADRTIASPTFSFTSDTDTGMYRASEDHLSLSAGGQSITISEAIQTSPSTIYWMGIYPTNTADGTGMNGTDTRPYVNLGTYPSASTGWNYQMFNAVVAGYHAMAYDGNATNPSLYWAGSVADTNTGFYWKASGNVGYTDDGTHRVDFGGHPRDSVYNDGGTPTTDTSNPEFGVSGSAHISSYLYVGELRPETDDVSDIGTSTRRFDNIYATSGTVNTSDARAKEKISPSTLGLDFINDLNPVSYQWKAKKDNKLNQTHYGIIAQEVMETLKNHGVNSIEDFGGIMHDGDDKDYYGARYSEFIPILMKAVQELSAEIKELKEKN